jgi:inhibitor of KinA sporulation pathway (predicted exonuclease)
MFKGKTLVGAALKNDLKSLGIDPVHCVFRIEDIQDFFKDSKGQPISLACLGMHFLGEDVQGTKHSSIKDARLTALCDRKREMFKEFDMNRFSCPVMDQIRKNSQTNPKKKQINFDRCTCGTAKGKKKKRSGNKSTAQAIYLIDDDFDIDDYM